MRHLVAHLRGQHRTMYCPRWRIITDDIDQLDQIWIILHMLDPAESIRIAHALGIETNDPDHAFRRTITLVQAIMLDDENAAPIMAAIEATTSIFWDDAMYQSECRIEKGMHHVRTTR